MVDTIEKIANFPGLETDTLSWSDFSNEGLPHRKSEEYKFTPVTKLLERDWNPEGLPLNTPSSSSVDLFKTPYTWVFCNGKLIQNSAGNDILQVLNNSEIPSEKSFKPEWKDEFHSMNQSINAEGLYLKLSKGKTLDHPIYIKHIVDTTNGDALSVTRNYIQAEENSELSVVEEFVYIGDNVSFENIETHIIVEKSARVKSYKMQLQGGKQIQVGNTFVQQARSSYHHNVTVSMTGKLIRNNLQIFLNDEHCESHLFGLYMLNGKNHVDNHSTVDHRMPNCYSNELYKGILTETSTGVFNGKIFVRPDAQNTNAFQSNNNLLLSDQASLHTKPQLEIWADDVSCSHGCTSGQLDKEAMFYLQSRGLDKKQSKALLLRAFVSDVIKEIGIDEIREKIELQVDSILFD